MSGDYIVTNVSTGDYTLTASKISFWSNSTSVTVKAGETVTVHRALWLKGDLNNNGIAADAGDMALMTDASIGKITPDWRYAQNTNGIYADTGDSALLKDASAGKITPDLKYDGIAGEEVRRVKYEEHHKLKWSKVFFRDEKG